jgi:hypothetical protein
MKNYLPYELYKQISQFMEETQPDDDLDLALKNIDDLITKSNVNTTEKSLSMMD